MTTPNQQAITVVRGDDTTLTITFDQAVAEFDDVWFTVRESWATSEEDDAGAVFSAELGGGITSTGTYTAEIALPNANTVTWLNDDYVYDVQVKSSDKLYTTQRGTLRVIGDVTRST